MGRGRGCAPPNREVLRCRWSGFRLAGLKAGCPQGCFPPGPSAGGWGGGKGEGETTLGLHRFRRHPHCWRHRSDLRFSLTSSLALIPRSSLYYAGPTPITRNDVPISRSSAQSPLQSPFGHTHLHRSWRLECDISGCHHSANPGDQP